MRQLFASDGQSIGASGSASVELGLSRCQHRIQRGVPAYQYLLNLILQVMCSTRHFKLCGLQVWKKTLELKEYMLKEK